MRILGARPSSWLLLAIAEAIVLLSYRGPLR